MERRRNLRRARLLLAVLALSGLAACGGDAGGDASEQEDAATDVTITGFAYEPQTLEVPKGTTVRWINDDGIDHTVTSGTAREQGVPGVSKDTAAKPDGVFDETLPDKGAEASFTFDESGEFTYYCDIHAGMTGTVVVQ